MFKGAVKKYVEKSFEFIDSAESNNEYKIDSDEKLLNNNIAETFKEKENFFVKLHLNEILNQDERNKLFRSEIVFKLFNNYQNLILDFKSFSSITQNLMKEPLAFLCRVKKYRNEQIINTYRKTAKTRRNI